MRGASSQVVVEVLDASRRGAGVEDPRAPVYAEYPVYPLRVMHNGHSVRISIPRDAQRHLGVRRGDIVMMELREAGQVVIYKLDPGKLRSARVHDDPSRSD